MNYEELIGSPLDKALEQLKNKDVIITDISHPDKFHADVKSTKRVIRASEKDGKTVLFVAGFVDNVTE